MKRRRNLSPTFRIKGLHTVSLTSRRGMERMCTSGFRRAVNLAKWAMLKFGKEEFVVNGLLALEGASIRLATSYVDAWYCGKKWKEL